LIGLKWFLEITLMLFDLDIKSMTSSMHRTDSYFRRNPNGSSLRRFSFRRKPTRESTPIPTSTWTFDDDSQEWQLLRGNQIVYYQQYKKRKKKLRR
jgi:hypothetical protein